MSLDSVFSITENNSFFGGRGGRALRVFPYNTSRCSLFHYVSMSSHGCLLRCFDMMLNKKDNELK